MNNIISQSCYIAGLLQILMLTASARRLVPFQLNDIPRLSNCPTAIEDTGSTRSNWTVIHRVESLLPCASPKLLDFPLYNPILDHRIDVYIRAVTSTEGAAANLNDTIAAPPESSFWAADTGVNFQFSQEPADAAVDSLSGQVYTAASELKSYLAHAPAGNVTTLYAHYGRSVVGIYVGARVYTPLAAIAAVGAFANHVREHGIGKSLAMQYCGEGILGGTVVGVFASTAGGVAALGAAQQALVSWDKGQCVTGLEIAGTVNSVLWVHPPIVGNASAPDKPFRQGSKFLTLDRRTTSSPSPRRGSATLTPLANRDNALCEETLAEPNDSCYSLSQRCGLSSLDEFKSYNEHIDCEAIVVEGQSVCCTAGTRRSRKKTPQADGTCATYVVVDGDNCSKVGIRHDATPEDLEKWNDGTTWGWKGCNLFPDTVICVSPGDPPLPLVDERQVCGPRAGKGIGSVPKGANLAELNPCPLNACCSEYGFCGVTEEFCQVQNTGRNPGTGGCISNCGMTITNNDEPPQQFIKIGYFEGWNQERKCLRMSVEEAARSGTYTHLHFAFARLTPEFKVDVSFIQDQFDRFKSLSGIKRVVSFGGWVDSTAPDRFKTWRNAALPENVDKVANTLVAFAMENRLDGLDIDWEYPAAPDIPDIDPADPDEGRSYLELLKTVRSRLPQHISLSIASPASYWYLKGLPIAEIARVVDYVVYMTYDFHGQWDHGKMFSIDGCSTGDCLRSHINMTETMGALTLITKAGVPSNKIIVGVASYGRAFKMAEPGCTGPMCAFTGPNSGARGGLCTGEPGYLADGEIERILKDPKRNARAWIDKESMSNIMVYDDTEWVAYMDDANKNSRAMLYEHYNFGGTTDWAIDLQTFSDSEFVTDTSFAEMMQNGGRCPWRNTEGFHCDSEAASNTLLPGKQRWDGTACDCAWYEFVDEWLRVRDRADRSAKFSSFAATFFKADDIAYECNDVLVGCANMHMQCPDVHISNMTGPAGALIVGSFAELSVRMTKMYEAFSGVEAHMLNQLNQFYDTFVEIEKDESQRNFLITVDALGIFFSVFSAPFFNNILKNSVGNLDNVKDITYNLVGWGGSMIKDAAQFEGIGGASLVALNSNLTRILTGYRSAVKDLNWQLFSGKEEGLDNFWALISEGKLAKGGKTQSEINNKWDNDAEWRRTWAIKVIYTLMIPLAWYEGSRSPVVLDTGRRCDSGGYLNGNMMDAETERVTVVCDEDKWLYYLVTPKLHWESKSIPPSDCTPVPGGPYKCATPGRDAENYFAPLPGAKDLRDGGNHWGGITLDDIVIGSVNTWVANGRKNGAKLLDIRDRDQFERLFDNNGDPIEIRAAGVFRIPVCSPEEAYAGWKDAKDHKSTEFDNEEYRYWPCKHT